MALACEHFYQLLADRRLDFYAGVPDSLLKSFCAYVTDHAAPDRHVIAANEGAAVALACGYHLATGNAGVVYMQNSGLGNAINPLTSLVDPEVYSVPVLLLIGWRGEPGVKDEPQHVKQGRITPATLDALEIPWWILPPQDEAVVSVMDEAVSRMRDTSGPVALLVRKATFSDYALSSPGPCPELALREEALEAIVGALGSRDVVVSTTGKASRELFEIRERTGQGHGADFLTVGSMGHCSQVAMGIALGNADRRVVCIDGDGAVIMHMGALAIMGSRALENLKHIVLNNGAHESVGGQPTVGNEIDIPGIARACGYRRTRCIASKEEIGAAVTALMREPGPSLLEIKIGIGAREDLGRPTRTPLENKQDFMEFLDD